MHKINNTLLLVSVNPNEKYSCPKIIQKILSIRNPFKNVKLSSDVFKLASFGKFRVTEKLRKIITTMPENQ